MRYNIKYEKGCLKYLKRLNKSSQLRTVKAINELPLGDVKRLHGSTNNYRLRVGGFRIIFGKDEENQNISIIEIGPRGEVYNK